ncbi:MAG TPA: hypothetical protein DCL77_09955 [Prolixibacteraceae bacterium]|jgi:hypothetical protein|nr:hypothetical protein [Prolixibacteraceae bacterium]
MKNSGSHKILRYLLVGFVVFFALIGLALTSAYFAVKFHITDDSGVVDLNDRYFQDIKDKYGHASDNDSIKVNFSEARLLHNLSVLSKYYPANAFFIQNAYYKSHNLLEAQRMIHAVDLYMQDNAQYHSEVNQFEETNGPKQGQASTKSVFEWMNINEWQDFKLAVAKDKHLIDSAAYMTGVEPRLIVAMLVGEQIRLFNSSREAYKKWIGPLKILSVETTFSLGVTGIKVPTAQRIEQNLMDSTSLFYLGEKYKHLLDFQTKNTAQERFNRLTSYKNHYYSYLYAALNVKQIKVQWEKSGFPINDRPEILATLYNIGYEVSVPKENPVVGGSGINIKGKKYSFGAVAYEFYYSGELYDLFPFKNAKFDFTDV